MDNLNRFLELAGIKPKTAHVKQLHEHSLAELEYKKNVLETQIKGSVVLTEHVDNLRFQLSQVDKAIKLVTALEEAKKVEAAKVEACEDCKTKHEGNATCKCDCHLPKEMKEALMDGSVQHVPHKMGDDVYIHEPEDKNFHGLKGKVAFVGDADKILKGEPQAATDKTAHDDLYYHLDTDKGTIEAPHSSVRKTETVNEAKSGEQLQDSQPSAAQNKDDVANVFDGNDEEKDNATELHQDATGVTQDRETKVKVPREVYAQIDQRIKELKDSISVYDKTSYAEQYSNKQKAIENLEFIKEKLKMGNMEGYKQAQIHYGTLASLWAGNLFPAKLVDFLHDGQGNEMKEVAFGDYMKGDKNKPTEGEVPGNAIYKPLNTSIYPQNGEDNVPKK